MLLRVSTLTRTHNSQQHKLYKVKNLSDEDATLLEPAACAIHGLDKLRPPVGVEVLLLGAGPTGLILAQLLKQNGAARVVIAANKGIKMNIAKDIEAADEYIELDRANPEAQWQALKDNNPYGFDIVVEATGVEKLANESINYVRRGGTLMLYGVYENKALVHWPPSKVRRASFLDQLFTNPLFSFRSSATRSTSVIPYPFIRSRTDHRVQIIGSFSQTFCFPRAIAYLESGKIKTKGMVTDTFKLEDYQKALDKMSSRDAVKICIKP